MFVAKYFDRARNEYLLIRSENYACVWNELVIVQIVFINSGLHFMFQACPCHSTDDACK